jgi:hypothetical protein
VGIQTLPIVLLTINLYTLFNANTGRHLSVELENNHKNKQNASKLLRIQKRNKNYENENIISI